MPESKKDHTQKEESKEELERDTEAKVTDELPNDSNCSLKNENQTNDLKNKSDHLQREDSKKGISITRALILFGYESWLELEPGKLKFILVIDNHVPIIICIEKI